MIEIISAKFKGKGKSYFFDPNGLTIKVGDKLIVDTAKGLEMADCSWGNHFIEDDMVVAPLRPVVRLATEDDMRVARMNAQREKEAFEICQRKIVEHGLDMKLVEAEVSFEGNKTMFFFTSDGRVDFRELVKDLAGVFHNRIELRQIGVRDEAKMLGGIGICGRPYCCNQFLEDFQPVSTKMAKVQSLSLNPTKISGSCGRLMCCLRYEESAYEDLLKSVPKAGAFVETKDGYGTAVQVNLLRQTVKVKMDGDDENDLRLFNANELVAVPGGRPSDGSAPARVLQYVPEEEEPAEQPQPWEIPLIAAEEKQSLLVEEELPPEPQEEPDYRDRHRNRRQRDDVSSEAKPLPVKKQHDKSKLRTNKPRVENANNYEKKSSKPEKGEEPVESAADSADGKAAPSSRKPYRKPYHKGFVKNEKQGRAEEAAPAEAKKAPLKSQTPPQPKAEASAEAPAQAKPEGGQPKAGEKKPYNRRRGYYHKPKSK